MLTLQELEVRLEKITYKPSWRLRLEPHSFSHDVFLFLTFYTLDTYAKSDKILFADKPDVVDLRPEVKIGMRHRLRGPFLTYDQFDHAVLDAIDKCERHETREWFKVDGVMRFDPHKSPTRPEPDALRRTSSL